MQGKTQGGENGRSTKTAGERSLAADAGIALGFSTIFLGVPMLSHVMAPVGAILAVLFKQGVLGHGWDVRLLGAIAGWQALLWLVHLARLRSGGLARRAMLALAIVLTAGPLYWRALIPATTAVDIRAKRLPEHGAWKEVCRWQDRQLARTSDAALRQGVVWLRRREPDGSREDFVRVAVSRGCEVDQVFALPPRAIWHEGGPGTDILYRRGDWHFVRSLGAEPELVSRSYQPPVFTAEGNQVAWLYHETGESPKRIVISISLDDTEPLAFPLPALPNEPGGGILLALDASRREVVIRTDSGRPYRFDTYRHAVVPTVVSVPCDSWPGWDFAVFPWGWAGTGSDPACAFAWSLRYGEGSLSFQDLAGDLAPLSPHFWLGGVNADGSLVAVTSAVAAGHHIDAGDAAVVVRASDGVEVARVHFESDRGVFRDGFRAALVGQNHLVVSEPRLTRLIELDPRVLEIAHPADSESDE